MQKAMQAIGELITDEQTAEMVAECYKKIQANKVSADGLRQLKAIFAQEEALKAKAKADGIDWETMVAEERERAAREESHMTGFDKEKRTGMRPNKRRFLKQMEKAYKVHRNK